MGARHHPKFVESKGLQRKADHMRKIRLVGLMLLFIIIIVGVSVCMKPDRNINYET